MKKQKNAIFAITFLAMLFFIFLASSKEYFLKKQITILNLKIYQLEQQITSLSDQVNSIIKDSYKLNQQNKSLASDKDRYYQELNQEKLLNSYQREIYISTISAEETQKNIPGEIKHIYKKNGITYLSIDILSPNPDFLPGLTPFFVNQSTKVSEVQIKNTAIISGCLSSSDNTTSTNEQYSVQDFINTIKQNPDENYTYYFYILDNKITSVYNQCLP